MAGVRLIGVDTGGTFTDLVLLEHGRLRVHKVLSTPDAPERAILQGVRELELDPAGLRMVHGSTVATNAALEGKGAKTAYIGNRGLRDLLAIGRQARAALYDLQPAAVPPPLPPERCLECSARLAADGSEIAPLAADELAALAAAVARLDVEAVAVNLLYSFLDPRHEQALAAALPAGLCVALSSDVLPEIGEYERGIATFLNAWLGPVVAGYLGRLEAGLAGARVAVMQSSGEAIAAAQAAGQAVRMLLSGPAGGLVGARFIGALSGAERLLTFDMGGTSTDVALIDGEPRLTREGRIGRYPVAVPMVDMHTIGAGGGSLARLDAGGMLQVGPESAGADPGPVCYGRGGREPTVTDAHLVLGRLRADAFLGGRMRLDRAAARTALARLGDAMGCSAEAAADGVIRVANEQMARALRVISVERGVDPRGATLVSFGGAGGLHVCALAETMEIDRALVPVHAGVLSALGMLVARPGRQLVRTRLGLFADCDEAALVADLDALAAEGRAALVAEGVAPETLEERRALDLRYCGQSYTLEVPWGPFAGLVEAFEARHAARYGHRLGLPVELVNLRVGLRGPITTLALPQRAASEAARPWAEGRVHGLAKPVPCFERDALAPGQRLAGPALVTEAVATSWIAPGWSAEIDRFGNLRLERDRGPQGSTTAAKSPKACSELAR